MSFQQINYRTLDKNTNLFIINIIISPLSLNSINYFSLWSEVNGKFHTMVTYTKGWLNIWSLLKLIVFECVVWAGGKWTESERDSKYGKRKRKGITFIGAIIFRSFIVTICSIRFVLLITTLFLFMSFSLRMHSIHDNIHRRNYDISVDRQAAATKTATATAAQLETKYWAAIEQRHTHTHTYQLYVEWKYVQPHCHLLFSALFLYLSMVVVRTQQRGKREIDAIAWVAWLSLGWCFWWQWQSAVLDIEN